MLRSSGFFRIGKKACGSAVVGAVLWVLCVQYFLAEQLARLGWGGGFAAYSMRANNISDLGAVHCGWHGGAGGFVCSRLHWLMNSSFVLQGFLIFFGALLVRRLFPEGRIATVALGLIALSGVGVFLVGLFPEDGNAHVHYLGAAVHFLCGNAGMVMLGFAVLYWTQWTRLVGGLSAVAGFIGLMATLLLSAHHDFGIGTGGMERVAAYPLPLWLTGIGAWLLAVRGSSRETR